MEWRERVKRLLELEHKPKLPEPFDHRDPGYIHAPARRRLESYLLDGVGHDWTCLPNRHGEWDEVRTCRMCKLRMWIERDDVVLSSYGPNDSMPSCAELCVKAVMEE